MDLARSVAEEPTSSRMFCAAWPSVCEPGRPDTELAAPRARIGLKGRAMGVGFRRGEKTDEVEKGRRSTAGVRRMAVDSIVVW